MRTSRPIRSELAALRRPDRLPLTAFWIEDETILGERHVFSHASTAPEWWALAFFNFADPAQQTATPRSNRACSCISRSRHSAEPGSYSPRTRGGGYKLGSRSWVYLLNLCERSDGF